MEHFDRIEARGHQVGNVGVDARAARVGQGHQPSGVMHRGNHPCG
jgi:hypothetical protein